MGKLKLPKGLYFYDGKGYVINKVIVKGQKPFYKRLGLVTEQEAINQFSLIVSSHLKGENVSREVSSLTVYNILEYYYKEHLINLASGKDARFHIPVLDKYLGHIKIVNLKKTDIEKFKLNRSMDKNKSGEPISKRTIQAELQLLSMAMNRAVDDEILPRNPIARFCKVSVPRRRKIVIDHGREFGSDWIKLYRHLPAQWKLFFLVCYETGMRPSEAANLQTEWLQKHGDNYLIKVPSTSEKTEFDDRRIPVSKILQKRLIKALPVSGKVFGSWDYFKAFKQAVEAAKLPSEVTAYSLRRTRATIWDAIDSPAARVALGHVPLDPHEESYVEITNERLFKLVGIELENKNRLRLFKVA